MSDRMTNTEIEDVLTSIRRLVSEEARFPFRSERRAMPEEPADKLVLTPDFRVSSDAEAAAEAVPEPGPAPVEAAAPEAPTMDPAAAGSAEAAGNAEPEPAEPEPAAPALHERVAVLEAAVSEGAEEFEPDGSEVTPSAYLSEPLPELAEDAAEPEAEAAAEPEAVEVWPDTASETELATAPEEATAPDEPVAPDDATVAAEAIAPDALAEPEAAPEAAAAEEAAMDWEEEPQPLPRFAHRAEAEAGPGLFEEPEADELDEEALREMIREVIREELQGSLGERITRNLRKLVRAEVNRALAGREFGG
jgi:hypothetical protein